MIAGTFIPDSRAFGKIKKRKTIEVSIQMNFKSIVKCMITFINIIIKAYISYTWLYRVDTI